MKEHLHLTPSQVARRLGIDREVVVSQAESGTLKGEHTIVGWLFDPEYIEAMVAARQ